METFFGFARRSRTTPSSRLVLANPTGDLVVPPRVLACIFVSHNSSYNLLAPFVADHVDQSILISN